MYDTILPTNLSFKEQTRRAFTFAVLRASTQLIISFSMFLFFIIVLFFSCLNFLLRLVWNLPFRWQRGWTKDAREGWQGVRSLLRTGLIFAAGAARHGISLRLIPSTFLLRYFYPFYPHCSIC